MSKQPRKEVCLLAISHDASHRGLLVWRGKVSGFRITCDNPLCVEIGLVQPTEQEAMASWERGERADAARVLAELNQADFGSES